MNTNEIAPTFKRADELEEGDRYHNGRYYVDITDATTIVDVETGRFVAVRIIGREECTGRTVVGNTRNAAHVVATWASPPAPELTWRSNEEGYEGTDEELAELDARMADYAGGIRRRQALETIAEAGR